MHGPLLMGRLKGLAQLKEQAGDAGRIEPAVFVQQGVKRDAFDVLHHDARPLRIVERRIVKGHDVWMLKASHEQRFALKSLAEFGVGGDVVVHDFDDDLPSQVGLLGQIDSAHAAFAEELDRFVTTQKDTSDHGGNSPRNAWSAATSTNV